MGGDNGAELEKSEKIYNITFNLLLKHQSHINISQNGCDSDMQQRQFSRFVKKIILDAIIQSCRYHGNSILKRDTNIELKTFFSESVSSAPSLVDLGSADREREVFC